MEKEHGEKNLKKKKNFSDQHIQRNINYEKL